MDNEFEKVQDHVPAVNLNTPAASEHIGEIERRIQVIKERARGYVCTLPYPELPQQIVIHLLHFIVMWLNNFPTSTGISTRWSPRELILRHKLDYKSHCRALFGSYCEAHEDHKLGRNTMKSRGIPSICLGPTGNLQGTYNFFSLVTGQIIKRRSFTELPARTRAPPKRYGFDDYHVFTTMAEKSADDKYPYTNATGKVVDLAITDELLMAQVCQYVMLHTADKLYANTTESPLKKQYGLKAGLKKFEERGSQAIMKELTQFHTLDVFLPRDPKTLTRDDRRHALTSLMFLTEKRSGEVKARTCANGSVQRDHIAKEEATAPTVTTESIFIQGTIYAHECRDVATCNIPGAFLQADNPDYVAT
jgi:hypothetical protein